MRTTHSVAIAAIAVTLSLVYASSAAAQSDGQLTTGQSTFSIGSAGSPVFDTGATGLPRLRLADPSVAALEHGVAFDVSEHVRLAVSSELRLDGFLSEDIDTEGSGNTFDLLYRFDRGESVTSGLRLTIESDELGFHALRIGCPVWLRLADRTSLVIEAEVGFSQQSALDIGVKVLFTHELIAGLRIEASLIARSSLMDAVTRNQFMGALRLVYRVGADEGPHVDFWGGVGMSIVDGQTGAFVGGGVTVRW